ncbi:MAG: excisionase [Lactococcus lactis]|nr:excisionase [Lactococcus lactis]
MPYAKVTYVPVDIPEKAEWCDKDHLMEKWEGLSRPTLTKWLEEMRDIPEFKEGVRNPTHKIVFINKKIFEDFVQWKEETRYKEKRKRRSK